MMIISNWTHRLLIAVAAYLLFFTSASADERSDTLSVTISFRQSKHHLDTAFRDNGKVLRQFKQAYEALPADKSVVHVIGYASPEGTLEFNRFLSRTRAQVIVDFLEKELSIPADRIVTEAIGVDWPDLYRAVLADPNVPQRQRVLDIIQNVPEVVLNAKGQWVNGRKRELMNLNHGRTWDYMLQNIYPNLRGAQAMLYCTTRTPETEADEPPLRPAIVPAPEPEPITELLPEEPADTIAIPGKPFYMSLHTNMLYDALAIPNVGAEVYLGKNYSLAGNWWYAWWKTDRRHRYWRTYGGYLAARYWFGKAAHAKPLTGHHAGIYGQIMLYDFEWGGTGYLSGQPHKNIFHDPTWGAGLEYGFALPVGRHLNIDFTIGLGYMNSKYWKYIPHEDGYMWTSQHRTNWWGPTKAEISLVWLLGRGNVNSTKGGEP